MVTKTEAELADMTPAELKTHFVAEQKTVFGHDHKVVKGHPVEQGIGAPGRETSNHWAAMRKAEAMGHEKPGTTERLMAEAKAKKK